MAHVRRKFFDIHAEAKPPQTHEVLQQIAALYAVETLKIGPGAKVEVCSMRARRSGRDEQEDKAAA